MKQLSLTKRLTLTENELYLIRDAVEQCKTKLQHFADEQHNYTVACNVSGFLPEAKASSVLEQKLNDDLEQYDRIYEYLELVALDRADAIIRIVNTYGKKVSQYPDDMKLVLEMHVTNCYWSGLFQEINKICSRCPKRKRYSRYSHR